MENQNICAIGGGILIYLGINWYCSNVECRGYQHYPHEPVSRVDGFAGFNNNATYTTTSGTTIGSAITSTTS
ncbi:MAG: hypothetical protein ACHP9Y_06325 [Gammaproteobacteria bacterium]